MGPLTMKKADTRPSGKTARPVEQEASKPRPVAYSMRAAPVAAPQQPVLVACGKEGCCPAGHELQWGTVETATTKCCACSTTLTLGQFLFGCEPCEYRACLQCARRPPVMPAPAAQSAASLSQSMPAPRRPTSEMSSRSAKDSQRLLLQAAEDRARRSAAEVAKLKTLLADEVKRSSRLMEELAAAKQEAGGSSAMSEEIAALHTKLIAEQANSIRLQAHLDAAQQQIAQLRSMGGSPRKMIESSMPPATLAQ